MTHIVDILGEASLGGWLRFRKKHLLPPGTPCANCETELKGAYCYNCGQLAETFERSISHLLVEALESLFHLDGRMFHTLPRLALKPGQLTRNFLDGKRAFQIPPLRMFLVVLLAVFFVGGLGLGAGHGTGQTKVNLVKPGGKTETITVGAKPLTPDQQSKVNAAFGIDNDSAEAARDKAEATREAAEDKAEAERDAKQAAAEASANPGAAGTVTATTVRNAMAKSMAASQTIKPPKTNSAFGLWLKAHLQRAMKDPDLFWLRVEGLAHNTAFLALPIAAGMLSLLYVFQRRFYIFDHLIFSMHSLSFQGLIMTSVFLLRPLTGWADALFLLSPVHLFVHMRGTYGSSVIGTLIRMTLLFFGSIFWFSVLFTTVLWLSLSGMDH